MLKYCGNRTWKVDMKNIINSKYLLLFLSYKDVSYLFLARLLNQGVYYNVRSNRNRWKAV